MNSFILNPNCSEAVVRLYTEDTEKLKTVIRSLKEELKIKYLREEDNVFYNCFHLDSEEDTYEEAGNENYPIEKFDKLEHSFDEQLNKINDIKLLETRNDDFWSIMNSISQAYEVDIQLEIHYEEENNSFRIHFENNSLDMRGLFINRIANLNIPVEEADYSVDLAKYARNCTCGATWFSEKNKVEKKECQLCGKKEVLPVIAFDKWLIFIPEEEEEENKGENDIPMKYYCPECSEKEIINHMKNYLKKNPEILVEMKLTDIIEKPDFQKYYLNQFLRFAERRKKPSHSEQPKMLEEIFSEESLKHGLNNAKEIYRIYDRLNPYAGHFPTKPSMQEVFLIEDSELWVKKGSDQIIVINTKNQEIQPKSVADYIKKRNEIGSTGKYYDSKEIFFNMFIRYMQSDFNTLEEFLFISGARTKDYSLNVSIPDNKRIILNSKQNCAIAHSKTPIYDWFMTANYYIPITIDQMIKSSDGIHYIFSFEEDNREVAFDCEVVDRILALLSYFSYKNWRNYQIYLRSYSPMIIKVQETDIIVLITPSIPYNTEFNSKKSISSDIQGIIIAEINNYTLGNFPDNYIQKLKGVIYGIFLKICKIKRRKPIYYHWTSETQEEDRVYQGATSFIEFSEEQVLSVSLILIDLMNLVPTQNKYLDFRFLLKKANVYLWLLEENISRKNKILYMKKAKEILEFILRGAEVDYYLYTEINKNKLQLDSVLEELKD